MLICMHVFVYMCMWLFPPLLLLKLKDLSVATKGKATRSNYLDRSIHAVLLTINNTRRKSIFRI